MEITEVRIKLMDEAGSGERLQGFCSITFDDCFVVRDLKIIEGTSGPFVAMPSRKLTAHCRGCGCKNHLRAHFCNQCGARLDEDRVLKDDDGRAKLYADIAHPINSSCREMIQNRVISAYRDEVERSTQPGYVSRYDDYDDELPIENARSAHGSSASRNSQRTNSAVTSGASSQDVNNKVEPAEQGPRRPHKSPSSIQSTRPPGRSRGEFGAGIL